MPVRQLTKTNYFASICWDGEHGRPDGEKIIRRDNYNDLLWSVNFFLDDLNERNPYIASASIEYTDGTYDNITEKVKIEYAGN